LDSGESFWVVDCHLLFYPCMVERQWESSMGSLYMGVNSIKESSNLMFWLPLKDLVSLYNHNGIRISMYEFWGGT
jgi:hypothetical protein